MLIVMHFKCMTFTCIKVYTLWYCYFNCNNTLLVLYVPITAETFPPERVELITLMKQFQGFDIVHVHSLAWLTGTLESREP